MDNNMENLCECLKMTELKKEKIIMELSSIGEVVDRGKTCLLIKLLTKKHFNKEAFKATMKIVWRLTKSVCFHEMGAGLMLAEFENLNDKNRVLHDGSWNFDKCLILVKEFEGVQQEKNIKLTEVTF